MKTALQNQLARLQLANARQKIPKRANMGRDNRGDSEWYYIIARNWMNLRFGLRERQMLAEHEAIIVEEEKSRKVATAEKVIS